MSSNLSDLHRQRLTRFRHSMNLIGPGKVQDHFDDCLAAISLLTPTGTWADLGSGAGFPGLVLANQFPDLPVDLVESRQKRCTFLEGIVLASGRPQLRVVRQRVETLDDASYDGLISRAFAPPPVVLELASRILRSQGTLVFLLQDDQPLPEHEQFTQLWAHRYQLNSKSRRSVALTKR